jgi:phosphohistidine phosphatase
MKSLYLLRHAKSSWDAPGLADHDRPLAPRGRRAAKTLAKHIRREGIAPALVLCSPARRARETLAGIAPVLGEDTEVELESDLYGAAEDDLLGRLRAIPETVPSVILIGHNPGIQALALELASGPGRERIADKYPTGALATFTFDRSWRELGPRAAELVAYVRPKDLG